MQVLVAIVVSVAAYVAYKATRSHREKTGRVRTHRAGFFIIFTALAIIAWVKALL